MKLEMAGKGISFGIILLGTLLFPACSTLPSENDAEDVFGNRWKNKIDRGEVRINSFDKINGQELEILGVKIYKIEFEVEMEYLKDNKPEFLKKAVGTDKGKIKYLKGTIRFEKTERGWKGPDGNLY